MFWVPQPPAARAARYWLAGGAPWASPKEAEEPKVTWLPAAAACSTPPPAIPPGGSTWPPFFSAGETISHPRSSGRAALATAAPSTAVRLAVTRKASGRRLQRLLIAVVNSRSFYPSAAAAPMFFAGCSALGDDLRIDSVATSVVGF